MVKKSSKKSDSKVAKTTISNLEEARIGIEKINQRLNEWVATIQYKKIAKTVDNVEKVNVSKEGTKTKLKKLGSTIKDVNRSLIRTPNDNMSKAYEDYKKEFVGLGGKLEDLKLK